MKGVYFHPALIANQAAYLLYFISVKHLLPTFPASIPTPAAPHRAQSFGFYVYRNQNRTNLETC